MDAAAPSALFPACRFIKIIGSGSYGAVWLAQDASGAYCAIKHIPATDAGRLDREAARLYRGVNKS